MVGAESESRTRRAINAFTSCQAVSATVKVAAKFRAKDAKEERKAPTQLLTSKCTVCLTPRIPSARVHNNKAESRSARRCEPAIGKREFQLAGRDLNLWCRRVRPRHRDRERDR